MIKRKSIICLIAVIGTTILFSFRERSNTIQEKVIALMPGDTTSFIPNTAGGWSAISSYINQDTPDSVDFELLLTSAGGIDGNNEKLIGTITNPLFIPKKNQKQNYILLPGNEWKFRITTTGDCYMIQVKGKNVQGDLSIIPVKIMYRNN